MSYTEPSQYSALPQCAEAKRIHTFRTILLFFWALMLVTSCLLSIRAQRQTVENIAAAEARAAIGRDLLYRRWAAMHGGVYAPPTPLTPPNPYLSHVAKRDVTTTDGSSLTLVNPAYMTRQVYELAVRSGSNIGNGHLTSLKPLRPENAPDSWEKQALASFDQGKGEYAELIYADKGSVMRLMRPFVTEESCLKCHAVQGYKVGDVRGGLSVTIPVQPLLDATRKQSRESLLGHGVIWLIGSLMIGFGGKKLADDARVKQRIEDELHLQADQLESEIAERQMAQEELQEQAVLLEEEIAERKQIEGELLVKSKQLEALNKTLEERIGEAVAELRQKDQVLIQQGRLAAMGEMVNNIAHQWRQPLNNVGLLIQNLQMAFDAGTLTQQEMEQGVDNAMKAIVYMSHTIDDFRNFFRSDKQMELFLPHTVVRRTLEFLGATLESQGISIRSELSEAVTTFGYPNEYAQVVINILTNARDAFLERQIEHPEIVIKVSELQGKALLTIADNAGGIDADILPKIFDPYFTTKDPGKGTGIGLYMSKVIIEQNMRGTLTARNCSGGVEFSILL